MSGKSKSANAPEFRCSRPSLDAQTSGRFPAEPPRTEKKGQTSVKVIIFALAIFSINASAPAEGLGALLKLRFTLSRGFTACDWPVSEQ